MIIDTQLEQRTDWQKKVGADIGGVAPDSYGWMQTAEAMKFYTKGKAYADWLAACHRPYLPNTGRLTLALELMTDVLAPTAAQAIELDTRIAIAGNDNNCSFQNNYARGGMLQLSGQDGNWVDTGVMYGKFTPRQWYAIRLHYGFDVTMLTYRTDRIDINDEVFYPTLPTLKAVKLGWSDGAHLQVQQDISSTGGGFDMYIRNMRYEWS